MHKAVFGVLLFLIVASRLPALEQGTARSQALVQYILDAKMAGLKDTQIQQNAEKAGWPAAAVKDTLDSLATPTSSVVTNEKKPVTNPVVEKKDPQEEHTAAAPASTGTGNPVQSPPPDPAPAKGAAPALDPAAGTKPTAVNRGVADEYQIGGGDIISISVFGEPTASAPSVVVRPDGKISMPLVKEVFVAGLTPRQLEKVITDQLSEKIQAPDVTVVVNQINSKKVFLLGAGVKREGPLPYSYLMTVMQALSEAGGVTDYAKRKKIYVLRNEGGRQYMLHFDYDAALQGEHMENNILLIPGDIVVVPNH